MSARPVSITIIAWVSLIGAAFGLLMRPFQSANPMVERMLEGSPFSVDTHLAVGAVGNLLSLLWGVGLLRGKDWARLGLVATSLLSMGFSLLTMSNAALMLPGVVVVLAYAFFLFRPAANVYFGRSWWGPLPEAVPEPAPGATAPAARRSGVRRVISIILYILAGWNLSGLPAIFVIRWPGELDGSAVVSAVVAAVIILLLYLVMVALPLGLGLIISEGNRRVEAGLTLLVSAGIFAVGYAFIALLVAMPAMRAQFESSGLSLAQLNPVGPLLPLLLTVLAGLWLFRSGRRAAVAA